MKKVLYAIPVLIMIAAAALSFYVHDIIRPVDIEPGVYTLMREHNGEEYQFELIFHDDHTLEEKVSGMSSEYMSLTFFKLYTNEWPHLFGNLYLDPDRLLPIPRKVEDGVQPVSCTLECENSQYRDPVTGEWNDWEERIDEEAAICFYFAEDYVEYGGSRYKKVV